MTFLINFTKFYSKDQGSKLEPLLMICRIRSLLLSLGFLIQIIIVPADGIRNNIHRNVSELLDDLLRGYDNSIRPDFGGPATVVDIDIVVRSMGPISEIDMSYSMDCYFRQSWIDQRLSYRSYEKGTLALSITMLERIWKPDTYFYNGKQSYLHTITTPNKFVRLSRDGTVLYSSRLTIKASCRMNLENFPMDIQRCPLKLGSFAYTTRDVLYRWKNVNRTVDIAKDMKMSQFDLISNPSGNSTEYMKSGEYSFLSVSFHLQRHTGNFLIQVYGPCTLLVVMSWVSFWLNREATAERVSLGITTILTMTFLGLEARIDLPKVSYPTALDFFVFLSFLFIFATIIQFAIVHYFTKYGSGEEYFMEESSSEEDEDEEFPDFDPEQAGPMSIIGIGIPPPPAGFANNNGGVGRRFAGIGQQIIVEERLPPPPPPCRPTSWPITFRGHRQGEGRVRSEGSKVRESRRLAKIQRQSEMGRVNSVSKIDIFARIAFPLSFFLINVFYWYSYLYSEQMLML